MTKKKSDAKPIAADYMPSGTENERMDPKVKNRRYMRFSALIQQTYQVI
jgi:hypothetical protein